MRDAPYGPRRPLTRDELVMLLDRLADVLETGHQAPDALRALAGRIHFDTLMER